MIDKATSNLPHRQRDSVAKLRAGVSLPCQLAVRLFFACEGRSADKKGAFL
jgi:hypothetical protein